MQVSTLAHDGGPQPSLEEEGPDNTRTRPISVPIRQLTTPMILHLDQSSCISLSPMGVYTPSTSRAYNTQARHPAPVIS